ncbi:MAG: tRNA (guanine-N7-)-methyltransferase [Candidatus Endobugula sp.]|jgi:tRNA (guanine-N7-)-methyltransferase
MSFTPAKPITSPQKGINERLETLVIKHLNSQSRKPIADYNQAAFEQSYAYWHAQGKPKLIVDSACGTGESSRHLAAIHPDHLVIGLDQSAKRLQHSSNKQLPTNCLLLRCECTDFWRLAEQAQWQFEYHSLLYPNPYPKPQHLQRRWHGEAAFTSLLAISKKIELRTNWKIYAEEFHQALLIAKANGAHLAHIDIEQYQAETSITAFERKYIMSGHALWRVFTS